MPKGALLRPRLVTAKAMIAACITIDNQHMSSFRTYPGRCEHRMLSHRR
jgi:hypothetical protein